MVGSSLISNELAYVRLCWDLSGQYWQGSILDKKGYITNDGQFTQQ